MNLATLERSVAPRRHQSTSTPERDLNPLEHAAHQQLRDTGRSPLRGVTCEINGSTARLSGELPSFFLKQMAQEVIRHVDGIHRVVNEIEVLSMWFTRSR